MIIAPETLEKYYFQPNSDTHMCYKIFGVQVLPVYIMIDARHLRAEIIKVKISSCNNTIYAINYNASTGNGTILHLQGECNINTTGRISQDLANKNVSSLNYKILVTNSELKVFNSEGLEGSVVSAFIPSNEIDISFQSESTVSNPAKFKVSLGSAINPNKSK